MKYRIWYSTESFADYIIANTSLKLKDFTKKKMYESDANNSSKFHTMPDHIKQILYLDAPDLIVELDSEPIFSVEVSTEAGSGHNPVQRFGRLAASVENNVPAFYVFPEAKIIERKGRKFAWDSINPIVFRALDSLMCIYQIPALLYYFPSDYRAHSIAATSPNFRKKGLKFDSDPKFRGNPDSKDPEMINLFHAMNEIMKVMEGGVVEGRKILIRKKIVTDRKYHMQTEFYNKWGGHMDWCPLTATIKVPTEYVLNYLKSYESANYKIGELLRSRSETIIYKTPAKFRGDPFPGIIAAIDYLLCREGKTFEERSCNLVFAWSDVDVDEKGKTIILKGKKTSVNDFVKGVQSSEKRNLLSKSYDELLHDQIPRYYMQVRYGSMFSKVKHIRMLSYFADAILFPDGALWRDA
jgi:hypothetical protein